MIYYYYYYYLRFALFFVHRKMIQLDYILWRHLGWMGGFLKHFITPCRGLRHHPAVLH